jgi:hypothetical protein
MTTDKRRTWREYYDNEYITGDALPEAGRTFTIADKGRAELDGKDGKEHKLCLVFTDGNKWAVNVTNAVACEHLFGSKFPADWVGHQITLVFDPSVMFGKDRVGGIRVKGSPELDKPLTFQFQENSRKKPRTVTLQPTVSAATTATTAASQEPGGSAPQSGHSDAETDNPYADEEIQFEAGPE